MSFASNDGRQRLGAVPAKDKDGGEMQKMLQRFAMEQHRQLQECEARLEKLVFEQRSHFEHVLLGADDPDEIQEVTSPGEQLTVADDVLLAEPSVLVEPSDMEKDVGNTTSARSYQEMQKRLDNPQMNTVSRLLCLPERQKMVALCKSVDQKRSRCSFILQLVESTYFKAFVSFMILLNGALMGYNGHVLLTRAFTDYSARSRGSEAPTGIPEELKAVDLFFCVFFIIELVLKVAAYQCEFFTGSDVSWNMLDLFVVLLCVLELGMKSAADLQLTYLRLLRVLKTMRTFRVLKIFRFASVFRDLRLMLLAIMHAIVPLFWAGFFLTFMIFLFAVVFVQAVAYFVMESNTGSSTVAEMEIYFESMQMTLLSLFMCVTGGVSYWEVLKLLKKVGVLYVFIFVAFIIILLLAVMNIVTGIFVGNALDVAAMDKDMVAEAQKAKSDATFKALQKLFFEVDADNTGSITMEELKTHLASQSVKAFLTTIGLDASNAVRLFKVLDEDESGYVELDEFVMGFMEIQNGRNSVSVDLKTLMLENKRILTTVRKNHAGLLKEVDSIKKSFLQSPSPKSLGYHVTREDQKSDISF